MNLAGPSLIPALNITQSTKRIIARCYPSDIVPRADFPQSVADFHDLDDVVLICPFFFYILENEKLTASQL